MKKPINNNYSEYMGNHKVVNYEHQESYLSKRIKQQSFVPHHTVLFFMSLLILFPIGVSIGVVNSVEPEELNNHYYYLLIIFCGIFFAIDLPFIIIFLIKCLRTKKLINTHGKDYIRKYVNKHTVKVLEAKNDDTLGAFPIFGRKPKDIFFMDKGIFQFGNGFWGYNEILWIYNRSIDNIGARITLSFDYVFALTCEGKEILLGSGIDANHANACFSYAKSKNPQMLIGFNNENQKKYKELVKAYKRREIMFEKIEFGK